LEIKVKMGAMALLGALFVMTDVSAGTPAKTLHEMAGRTPKPATLSNATLVIIDAQREYVEGALPLSGVKTAIDQTARLLTRARAQKTPVIHVVHRGGKGLFDPEGRFFEIVPPLKPQEGEAIIEKRQISSFTGTRLEEALRRTGRKKLIVAGFMTHNCVSSTVRAAFELGFEVTVVADTTATRDLPDGKGGVLKAEVLQTASLAALADRNAVVAQREADIPD
jgi:nicotinamidase-related amidase